MIIGRGSSVPMQPSGAHAWPYIWTVNYVVNDALNLASIRRVNNQVNKHTWDNGDHVIRQSAMWPQVWCCCCCCYGNRFLMGETEQQINATVKIYVGLVVKRKSGKCKGPLGSRNQVATRLCTSTSASTPVLQHKLSHRRLTLSSAISKLFLFWFLFSSVVAIT